MRYYHISAETGHLHFLGEFESPQKALEESPNMVDRIVTEAWVENNLGVVRAHPEINAKFSIKDQHNTVAFIGHFETDEEAEAHLASIGESADHEIVSTEAIRAWAL
jgi:hypothetical protein